MRIRPSRKALAKWGRRACLAGLGLALLLLFLTRDLLCVQRPLPRADWIVVLGGESSQRVIGAAELYHAGVAPRVFVSGSGDCRLIVRRLVMAGVPPAAIRYECRSRSTYGNALAVREELAPAQPKKIVLVTTWHHTMRALSTFRNVWPEVEWGSSGVFPGLTAARFPFYEAGAIMAEYFKVVAYIPVHGVLPSR